MLKITQKIAILDEVNKNGRVYTKENFTNVNDTLKLVFSDLNLDSNVFESFPNDESFLISNYVGYVGSFSIEENGVFASIILDDKTSKGKQILDLLEGGARFMPAGIGNSDNDNQTISEYNLNYLFLTSTPSIDIPKYTIEEVVLDDIIFNK